MNVREQIEAMVIQELGDRLYSVIAMSTHTYIGLHNKKGRRASQLGDRVQRCLERLAQKQGEQGARALNRVKRRVDTFEIPNADAYLLFKEN